MRPFILPSALLLLVACRPETPRSVVRDDLGVQAIFPGETTRTLADDDSPFGRITWYGERLAGNALAESFFFEVGNLPAGNQGGATPQAVVATCEAWFRARFQGALDVQPLGADEGPGFRYTHANPTAHRYASGMIVIRRGRIHHAQASSVDPDPRAATFIASFKVK